MDDLLNSVTQIPQSSAQASLDVLRQDSNPSKADTDSQKLSDDLDTFLLLLTTQLKNQDPTEPLDVNEFTNQLVQFASVEQAVATNQNLETLVEAQTVGQLGEAVNYVGQFVDANGNKGQLIDGAGSFAYELDFPANTASIIITDSSGRAVFSGQGPTDAGTNRVIWDGINSFTGNPEPNGTYTLSVVAKNASGEDVPSKTYTTGPVSGARVKDGEVVLDVAGSQVKVSDVLAIRQPIQFNAPAPSGGGTDDAGEDETSLVDDVVDTVEDLVDDII